MFYPNTHLNVEKKKTQTKLTVFLFDFVVTWPLIQQCSHPHVGGNLRRLRRFYHPLISPTSLSFKHYLPPHQRSSPASATYVSPSNVETPVPWYVKSKSSPSYSNTSHPSQAWIPRRCSASRSFTSSSTTPSSSSATALTPPSYGSCCKAPLFQASSMIWVKTIPPS